MSETEMTSRTPSAATERSVDGGAPSTAGSRAGQRSLASVARRVRMGKRVEKAFARDKAASATQEGSEDDPNKSPEPYVTTGQFSNDFSELCRRNDMVVIPPVVIRPKRPPSPSAVPVVEEKGRGGKRDDKKNHPPPEPEAEPELDKNGEPPEPPPKTYVTKDKFEYLKPCVQVEMDHPDKQDTVTEVYVRGWKIDEPMMTIFKQCLPKLERLHTINFWNTGLTDSTLELLASFLPECPNVKNLSLDSNPVKCERYDLFLKDEMPVLNLSLRFNQITDVGAAHLGKALGTPQRSNTRLISMNLTGNKITDKGVEEIAKGLRMNRTLLSLTFANNQIGDLGAQKLGEVLSRFPLTHEEIVERRRLLSDKSPHDGLKSPPLGSSRRADSRDNRPGSVRSSHAGKGGKSAKSKKEGTVKGKEEDKHDKTTKGKKEAEKSVKKDTRGSKASMVHVGDSGKTNKKADKTKGKGKGAAQPELELSDNSEVFNALLDTVEPLENGTLMLIGNRTLLNLNLNHNQISEEGVKHLFLAVAYQTSLAQLPEQPRIPGTGILRLCLNRNKISRDSETMNKLEMIMVTKDPFYKPPQSPDVESASQA